MLNACQFNSGNLKLLVIAVCEFVENAHSHCAMSDQQFRSLAEVQVRMQINALISHWLEKQPGFDLDAQTRARAASACRAGWGRCCAIIRR